MNLQAFYGFTKPPFHKSIKTKDLFETEALKELESRLDYMLHHCGLMMVTGEQGTGKTTALRRFVESLNPQRYKFLYIPLSTVNVMDFYRQVNRALGSGPVYRKADLFRSIQDAIIDYSFNKKILPIFIFDEAHLLNRENLLELQLLTNFDMDSTDPALFILAGQTPLLDRMKLTVHESLLQRFQLKYHLPDLHRHEAEPYIEHHLKLAGRKESPFTPAAIEAIYQHSRGKLRLVGKLATGTLMAGLYKEKEILTEEEVYQAAMEL